MPTPCALRWSTDFPWWATEQGHQPDNYTTITRKWQGLRHLHWDLSQGFTCAEALAVIGLLCVLPVYTTRRHMNGKQLVTTATGQRVRANIRKEVWAAITGPSASCRGAGTMSTQGRPHSRHVCTFKAAIIWPMTQHSNGRKLKHGTRESSR